MRAPTRHDPRSRTGARSPKCRYERSRPPSGGVTIEWPPCRKACDFACDARLADRMCRTKCATQIWRLACRVMGRFGCCGASSIGLSATVPKASGQPADARIQVLQATAAHLRSRSVRCPDGVALVCESVWVEGTKGDLGDGVAALGCCPAVAAPEVYVCPASGVENELGIGFGVVAA